MAEWKSGLKVLTKLPVYIPRTIIDACDTLSRRDKNEFAILCNFTFDRSGITLDQEFFVPEQVVSEKGIEIKEDTSTYKCIIHRHPDSKNQFSDTDKEYINRNFDLSLLFTQKDKFVNGVFNHPISRGNKVTIPLEIHEESYTPNIVIPGLDKIKVEEEEKKPEKGEQLALTNLDDLEKELERLNDEIDRLSKTNSTKKLKKVERQRDKVKDELFAFDAFDMFPFYVMFNGERTKLTYVVHDKTLWAQSKVEPEYEELIDEYEDIGITGIEYLEKDGLIWLNIEGQDFVVTRGETTPAYISSNGLRINQVPIIDKKEVTLE